jgi:hypothetical protein
VIATLSVIFFARDNRAYAVGDGILLLAQAGFIISALRLARMTGAAMVYPNDPNAAVHRERPQFTLRQLLLLMTILAIAMGLIRWLVPADRLRLLSTAHWWVQLVANAGAGAAVTLAALWTALGTRWPAVRLLALLLTAAVARLIVFAHSPAVARMFIGAQGSLVFASLLVVRAAGYRLTWPRRAIR